MNTTVRKAVIFLVLLVAVCLGINQVAEAAGAVTVAGNNEVISEDVDGALFIAGNNVEVNGDVNGFVFGAGQTVTINGEVNGPVAVAGQVVTFNGTTEQDIFMAGNNVTIGSEAQSGRDVFTAGNNLQFNTTIGRDLFAGGNLIDIRQEVGRDGYLGYDTLSLAENVQFGGDVNYQANEEDPTLDEHVDGTLTYTEPAPSRMQTETVERGLTWLAVFNFIISLVGAILTALILWWVAKRLTNGRWLNLTGEIGTRHWLTFIIGLAVLILVPIIFILLLITRLLIGIGVLLLIAYLLLIFFATFIVASVIESNYLAERFNNTKYPHLFAFLLAFTILWLLTKIPILGFFISVVYILYALGLATRWFFSQLSKVPQPVESI